MVAETTTELFKAPSPRVVASLNLDADWRLAVSPPGPSRGHRESPVRRAQHRRLANASDHPAIPPPRHRCSARRAPGWCHGGAGARDRAGHRAAQPRCATSPTRPDIGADDAAGVRVQNKQRASKGDHAHRSINLSSPSNRSKSRSKLTKRQPYIHIGQIGCNAHASSNSNRAALLSCAPSRASSPSSRGSVCAERF